jgi:hypothetical protein
MRRFLPACAKRSACLCDARRQAAGRQHVRPSGYIKIRCYGFLSPSCAVPLVSQLVIANRLHSLVTVPIFQEDLPSLDPHAHHPAHRETPEACPF